MYTFISLFMSGGVHSNERERDAAVIAGVCTCMYVREGGMGEGEGGGERECTKSLF